MLRQYIKIGQIPSVLWGVPAEKVVLAVHGNCSYKEDTVMELLAEVAETKGWQVLTFDLPQHGERKTEEPPFSIGICIRELNAVMTYAKGVFREVSVFGCSVGAFLGLSVWEHENITQWLFLSPVTNMFYLVTKMLEEEEISLTALEKEKRIQGKNGTVFSWQDYCLLKSHPLGKYDAPMAILCGENDEVFPHEKLAEFAKENKGRLTTVEKTEHFFHRKEALEAYRNWLKNTILS